VGLRLGTLVSQIGGACRNADDRLRVHVEEPALRLAGQTEIGIERMLTVLGSPEPAFTDPDPMADESGTAGTEAGSGAAGGRPERNGRRDDGGLRATLAELERMRGGRFEAPPTGEFERYTDHAIRIGPRVGGDPAEALRRAVLQARRDWELPETWAAFTLVGFPGPGRPLP
jgi:hypothetical protein